MSLPHALLTSLVGHSASGSDLAQRFDRSLGYFWHATHQQIYRELARMEALGWIESLPAESGRGRKRAYQILPAGQAELRRWVGTTMDPQPLRNELMVRLRAEAALGMDDDATAALVQELRNRLQLHEAQLALYREFEVRDLNRQQGKPTRKQALQNLVLASGIQHEGFWIEICQKALAILQSPEYDSGAGAARD